MRFFVVVALSTAACHVAPKNASSQPVANADAAVEPASATPAALAPAADASPLSPPSPFHLFAVVLDDPEAHTREWGWPGDSRRHVHVCSTGGATMLCGMQGIYLLKDGAFVRDRSLEAGLPDEDSFNLNGRVYVSDVFGRWPDDAWLSFTADYPGPAYEHSLYRWHGRSWSLVRSGIKGDHVFLPWGAGAAIGVDVQQPYPGAWIEGFGARRGTNAIPPFLSREKYVGNLESPLTFADGMLAAVREAAQDDYGMYVMRWGGGTKPAELDRFRNDDGCSDGVGPDGVVHGLRTVTLWGLSPVDVVAFGWQECANPPPRGTMRSYLRHFDGQRWSPLAVPEGQDEVRSYERDAAGRAWIVTAAGLDPERTTLWRATTDGTWERILLPVECHLPWEVTRSQGGALWVACLGQEMHPTVERFLLSTLETSQPTVLDPYPAPPSQSRESVDPGASPLHVAAVRTIHAGSGVETAQANDAKPRVCSVGGVVWLCAAEGMRVWRGGAFDRDPALEVGLPETGWLLDVYGQWPDAWLVWVTPSTHKTHQASYGIYAWDGSQWSRRGAEAPIEMAPEAADFSSSGPAQAWWRIRAGFFRRSILEPASARR